MHLICGHHGRKSLTVDWCRCPFSKTPQTSYPVWQLVGKLNRAGRRDERGFSMSTCTGSRHRQPPTQSSWHDCWSPKPNYPSLCILVEKYVETYNKTWILIKDGVLKFMWNLVVWNWWFGTILVFVYIRYLAITNTVIPTTAVESTA